MKKSKKFSFLIVIFILLATGLLAWWVNAASAVDISNKTQQAFVIKKGEGIREIANDLKNQGLIKDPVIFYLIVKRFELDQKIQAGNFKLSPSMNSVDIAKTLQVGTSDIQVVIPEGKRAQEIADKLKESVSTYDQSWRGQLNLNEGYLFPDTYSFPQDVTIDQVIGIMRTNFEKKYSEIKNVQNSSLSKTQIVILASMVEREAKNPEDRPLVASVLLNRLKLGMPLQIDATIQYVLGYQPIEKTWWKKEITYADLKINSSYNTYTNTGLPPGPISNPGLDVLNAVVNPAQTNYIFYVSDKQGRNHYAATLAEHNANIAKYGL
ncbi:MAG TPA: endolytic transglycosylase MltG [Candidatus Saccharimonadales bacterium]|nr:endolytic transglycosylase MltG [Candidatus Saccharimonadales bacterium]